uniref:Uncharacterized protein n=1 Tax=Meloidogyne enterolobii TaxID=390850 RepID=A0A6V7X944_MELEN|nr:unnamed protein product [Meloidogyne enterolobii]
MVESFTKSITIIWPLYVHIQQQVFMALHFVIILELVFELEYFLKLKDRIQI